MFSAETMANPISIRRSAGAPPAQVHANPVSVRPKLPVPVASTSPAICGRVFDIKRFSSHDGPGIRTTVFLTGCPLRCAWCHNPEAFICQDHCPEGMTVREMTVPTLVRELERDLPYFDPSGGGVTISGGEPLFQSRFTRALLRACRDRELHTALDTTGCADPAVLLEAASLASLVLYDLKSMDPAVHAQWTGVDNRRILENLRLLDAASSQVWIRFPLVPGVNDSDENLEAMISFLSATRFRRVSILPFHRIAAAKYQRFNLPNRMGDTPEPDPAAVESVRARFAAAGFDPHIGR
jgi:pyruvate formate lyase activating enzyme